MIRMKITGVLMMICLSLVQTYTFPDRAVIVNEPLTLPCNCSGHLVEWTTIVFRTKESIAVCRNGTCQIDQRFQKRFSILGDTRTGNFSMSISSTVYNDIGYYECTCNKESVSGVKLKVYDPRVVRVFKGQNITLPCYGDTRRDAKDVQWKKDGKMFLEYPHTITAKDSGGRFTMSKENFLNGDLSLHISSVQLSDAALYLCLIHGESRDGDPRAVLLKVEEHQPEHQPPSCPNNYIQLPLALVFFLLLLIIISVIIYWVRKYRRPRDVISNNPGPPVQEEDTMIPKHSSTQLIQE